MYENPIGYSHVIKKYVREQSELFKKTHRMPGSAGFVVNSFMTAGFDPETGEVFDDAWSEDDEVKRYRGSIFRMAGMRPRRLRAFAVRLTIASATSRGCRKRTRARFGMLQCTRPEAARVSVCH